MPNQAQLAAAQQKICTQYGSAFAPLRPGDKVAIALDSIGLQPIAGRREVKLSHDPNEITWFIYCGEYRDDDDFFSPVHVSHLAEMLPEVLPYLALSEGFGFIIDHDGYEDVWCFIAD